MTVRYLIGLLSILSALPALASRGVVLWRLLHALGNR